MAAITAQVNVHAALDADVCCCISSECTDMLYIMSLEDSFQRLFWEQQQKAASLNNSCSMKWRLLIINWCLYLHHLSGKAHDTPWETGCVRLPSKHTLWDYVHGFSSEVDEQLFTVADLSNIQIWCVSEHYSTQQHTYIKASMQGDLLWGWYAHCLNLASKSITHRYKDMLLSLQKYKMNLSSFMKKWRCTYSEVGHLKWSINCVQKCLGQFRCFKDT